MVIAVLEALELSVNYLNGNCVFMKSAKKTIFFGVTLLFFAVLIGAFGAHSLGEVLENNKKLDVFDTASRYHFYHGFAIVMFGILNQIYKELRWQRTIVVCFLTGVLLFSGSLYLLAILNINWLGAITPIGGTLLLCGWAGLAYNMIADLSVSYSTNKQNGKEA